MPAARPSAAGQRWDETADTGLFWFFDEDNLELTAKVLDACAAFDRFWIFAAGMTNVHYDLRVTDLATGMTKIYTNPLGRVAQTIIDTDTFGCSVPEGSRPTR